MTKITAELKAELTNKKLNDNITTFYNKIYNNIYYFPNYSVKNNKLTFYLKRDKEELLTDPESNKHFEESKNYILGAVSESKEIYKSEYNINEITVNREGKEYVMLQFTAELYFSVKEFSNKDIINYLYHEAEKEAKAKLEYKLTDKIEIDREKFLFKILNDTINWPKAKIEKCIKENLKNNIFHVSFGDNVEYYKDFTNFEAETAEFNKKAEEYNKNLIKNYIKETDPELYFAKFSKETVKEAVKAEVKEEIKETVKEEEINLIAIYNMNFHDLNKFIKAGTEFMKLSAEDRFRLYNLRQNLYELTYKR